MQQLLKQTGLKFQLITQKRKNELMNLVATISTLWIYLLFPFLLLKSALHRNLHLKNEMQNLANENIIYISIAEAKWDAHDFASERQENRDEIISPKKWKSFTGFH